MEISKDNHSFIEIGEKYKDLNRSISIIFLDYKIEKLEQLPIHTKWQIRDSKNGKTILTKDLEIHIIEMPKIRERIEEGTLKKWILFLENPEGEETKKMAENEKEIKEAIETLEEISSDEAKERMAELRQKYIMDRAEELETAEEKGIKKRTIEIAKEMKKEKISLDKIVKITGLSKEEIKNL